MTAPLEVRVEPPERPPAGAADLLLGAFAGPPHDYDRARVERRLDSWPAYAAVPGFTVVTARRGPDLVGVAWGWGPVIGTPAQPGMFAGLYEDLLAQPWAGRLQGLEVVELAVAPAEQGAGLGARLLETLTSTGPAWLLTYAEAPAADWYARRGWTRLGGLTRGVDLVALAR